VLFPTEMISVVALTDHYVYSGDLLATVAMGEKHRGRQQVLFDSPPQHGLARASFRPVEKVTGEKFHRRDLGNGQSQIILKNMGTPFGNLGGVEVADNNHLMYLDTILRAGLETGRTSSSIRLVNHRGGLLLRPAKFRNSPSRYRCFCPHRTPFSSGMLMNIVKAYLRDDGTTPIYEINIATAPARTPSLQLHGRAQGLGPPGHTPDRTPAPFNPDLGMDRF